MIVRIMGEGQYTISEESLPALQELDLAVEQALDADDDQRFRPALAALLQFVRSRGTAVSEDALEPSEAILPAADAHVNEVRALLGGQGEGMIPGV